MKLQESEPKSQETMARPFRLVSRIVAGCLLALLLVGGVGGWAVTADLSGAVIASGSVAVDGRVKAIQHRDGGIIREIAVDEGDTVTKGQVLLRLEDAQTRAELMIIRAQLTELALRRARLLAERDGAESFALPARLDEQAPDVAVILAGERHLFDGQRRNRESRKQQLELTINQIGDEIRGLEAQRNAIEAERVLIVAEHTKMNSLADQGLIEGARLYSIDRERAQVLGKKGEIDADIARAQTRISEVNLQIIAIEETARTEAQRELSQVDTRIAELSERETVMEDLLSRTDIRAPIDGVVNEVNVSTLGGVVSPAEVLLTIVPGDAGLSVEAKIPAMSIDQVSAGQIARMRFTTFNHRTTPELLGVVTQVSAAATSSESEAAHFVAQIELTTNELAKLPSSRLPPGTPVEVFVQTEKRAALSYLARPLTDQFSRAMRER
ncbi:HlyD family type I secretion periplasmic adaptor subunit [Sedimentitalea sp.]|uniref:HlyD family type I secretion periplasmic adaptor subunit n=1 Tax=Sedimentitalea sp. TaxID=2048915 RepID=UPI0032975405